MRRQHGLIGIGGIGIGGWRRGLREIGQRKQHADGARCQDRTQNTNSKRKPAQALSRHAGALRALRHTRLCRRHQLRGAFDRFAAAASFSAVPRLSLAVAIQLHLVQASKPTHAGSRAHGCHAGSRGPGCRRRWHSRGCRTSGGRQENHCLDAGASRCRGGNQHCLYQYIVTRGLRRACHT